MEMVKANRMIQRQLRPVVLGRAAQPGPVPGFPCAGAVGTENLVGGEALLADPVANGGRRLAAPLVQNALMI